MTPDDMWYVPLFNWIAPSPKPIEPYPWLDWVIANISKDGDK